MNRWVERVVAVLVELAALVVLLIGLHPGALRAQDRSGAFALEVRAGWLQASRDLGRTGVLEGTGYVAFDRPDPTPVVGLGVEAPVVGPLSARLLVDYAFGTDAGGQWFCEAFLPCPAVLILVDARVRRWSALLDLKLRAGDSSWPVRPSVFVGIGRRDYRLTWESPVVQVPIPTAFDRTSWFSRTGVGAELGRGTWVVFAEADATLAPFGEPAPVFIEGTVPADDRGGPVDQLDVGLSVGARVYFR